MNRVSRPDVPVILDLATCKKNVLMQGKPRMNHTSSITERKERDILTSLENYKGDIRLRRLVLGEFRQLFLHLFLNLCS
jgi:hypothetical protein